MIYCENIVNGTLFFFTLPRFRNHIFSPPFSAMPLPQLLQFFSPISAIALPQLVCQNFFFSFHFGHSTHTSHTRTVKLDRGISVSTLPKFNIFSLHLFLLLSHTFGWILAMVIPKFNLSPHNPKKVSTVLITQIKFKFYDINPKNSERWVFIFTPFIGAKPHQRKDSDSIVQRCDRSLTGSTGLHLFTKMPPNLFLKN